MRNKMLFGVAALLVLMAGAAYQAHADTITITADTTTPVATGDETGNSKILAVIADDICTNEDGCPELYKKNNGGSEEALFAPYYSTTFNGDLSGGLIHWDGGLYITDPLYLLVKDGNQSPAWYLFDITRWDGKADISLANFWPGNGSISHVSIFGGGDPGGGDTPVPEPGTLVLLGSGIVAAVIVRRRCAK